MSKKPSAQALRPTHEESMRAIEAAAAALAPMAELLCAARLLRLGTVRADFIMAQAAPGMPVAIGLDPVEEWPTVWMWSADDGGRIAPRPMAAWLGDVDPEQWPEAFLTLALRAQESAEALGAAGAAAALAAVGAKPLERSGRPAMRSEMAQEWLARAVVGSDVLIDLRSQALAMGFKLDVPLDSHFESRELGRFAPLPEGALAGPSGPRL